MKTKNLLKPMTLLLALGLFAGCSNIKPEDISSVVDSLTDSSSKASESTSESSSSAAQTDTSTVDEDLEVLNAAKAYIKDMYKDVTNQTADFKLPNKTVIGADIIAIEWSLKEGNQTAIAQAADEGAYACFTVNYKNNTEADANFTLVAKLSFNGKEITIEFAQKVPQYKASSYEEWVEACANDAQVTVKGYINGVSPFEKKHVFIQDNEGHGFYGYNVDVGTMTEEEWKQEFYIGREVILSGKATIYNGCYEITDKCQYNFTEDSSVHDLVITDATDVFANATSNKDKNSLDSYQNALVKLENCTLGTKDGAYYYFTIGENKVQYNLYYSLSYFLTQEQFDELFAKFTTGYTATITGIVNVFSGEFQIYPNSVDSIVITSTDMTDAQKVEIDAKGALALPEKFGEATEVTLPATGSNGSALTYAYTGDADVVIAEDFSKMTVTPGAAEATGKLTVTALIGETSYSQDYTITVLPSEIETITIAEVKTMVSGDEVTVKGIINSIGINNSGKYNINIQDATGGAMVYNLSVDNYPISDFAIGDEITVSGKYSPYNGLHEIGSISLIIKGENKGAPAVIELENVNGIDAYQCEIVKIDLTYTGGKYLDANGTEIALYADTKKWSSQTIPELAEGQGLTVCGFVNWYNKAQITGVEGYTYITAHEIVLPEDPYYVYTNAEELATADLSDVYMIGVDASGKIIYASHFGGAGYGGPADGFYHDGTYTCTAGQVCGIFNVMSDFAGWPAKVIVEGEEVGAWTRYSVVVPNGGFIVAGSANAMLDLVNHICGLELTELPSNNSLFEEEITDGALNDVVVSQTSGVVSSYAYATKTAAEVKAMASGSYVKVTGVINSIGLVSNNAFNINFEDATGGLMAYNLSTTDFQTTDFSVGDQITVKGKYSPYNGLHEIGSIVSIIVGDHPGTPAVIELEDATNLNNYQCQLVKIELTYNNGKYYDKNGLEVAIYADTKKWSSQVAATLMSNQTVVVEGFVNCYNKAQLTAVEGHTYMIPGAIYGVYTNAEELAAADLSDVYMIGVDASGKIIYASHFGGAGYGGPADGFYHDGTYTCVAGQVCGIFDVKSDFAGWPAKVIVEGEEVGAWTRYSVVVPTDGFIVAGSAAIMLDLVNEICGTKLTELPSDNALFESQVEDGKLNCFALSIEEGLVVVTDNQPMTSYTATFTSTLKPTQGAAGTLKIEGYTWNYNSIAYVGSIDASKGLQIGSSKSPCTEGLFTVDFGSNYKIKSITVNSSIGSSGDGKLTVSVGETVLLDSQVLTTTATDYTATNTDLTATGALTIKLAATAKAMYIKSIVVEVEYVGE